MLFYTLEYVEKTFFVIVTVVCTACFSRGNYTVTGTVDSSYDGKTIYLESLGDTRERIIDSTVVGDGKFEFRAIRAVLFV